MFKIWFIPYFFIRDKFYVKNVNTLDIRNLNSKNQECSDSWIGISIIHNQCENRYVIYSLNTWNVSHFMHLCHNKLKWNEKLGNLRLDFVWLHWFDLKEESKEMHRRWKYKWRNKRCRKKKKERRMCAQNESTAKKILNIHLVRSRVVLMPTWNSIGVILKHVIHRFSYSPNNTIW